MEYRRAQIREHLGFRVCSVQDAEKLTVWLAANVAHTHRPMIDALALVQRYAVAGNSTYFPLGEVAPEHRGTWRAVGGAGLPGGQARPAPVRARLRRLPHLTNRYQTGQTGTTPGPWGVQYTAIRYQWSRK